MKHENIFFPKKKIIYIVKIYTIVLLFETCRFSSISEVEWNKTLSVDKSINQSDKRKFLFVQLIVRTIQYCVKKIPGIPIVSEKSFRTII